MSMAYRGHQPFHLPVPSVIVNIYIGKTKIFICISHEAQPGQCNGWFRVNHGRVELVPLARSVDHVLVSLIVGSSTGHIDSPVPCLLIVFYP